MEKNELFTTEITGLSADGEGIGHSGDGMAFFVKGALPGDRVKAAVTALKKTYGYARLVEVLTPSPDRVAPVCPVAGKCGGCSIMPLSYEAQCRVKSDVVREDLIRLGGFEPDYMTNVMRPCIRMTSPFPTLFRNKAQFPVGRAADGHIQFGFYGPHSHRIVENVEADIFSSEAGGKGTSAGSQDGSAESPEPVARPICALGPVCSDAVISRVKAWMESNSIEPYNEETGKGLVRNILIRQGRTTGEIMVCPIVNGNSLPRWEALADSLFELSGMTSFSFNINTTRGNTLLGRETHLLRGSEVIHDTIGDLTFRISPNSFFQVNPEQTERLYAKALEYAGLTGSETVWDLYCGTGTISLFLARHAVRVCGVEIVPQAIEDAKKNAAENGITNAAFTCGKSENVVVEDAPAAGSHSAEAGTAGGQVENRKAAREENIRLPRPDIIVVDPPRKGCDGALLTTILSAAPARIVYVSCNPATLARDLKVLCADGRYTLDEVTPVEQFAHSMHVETVVLMSKVKG